MTNKPEINKDFINQSLLSQLSQANYMIAEREAMIEQLNIENKQLAEKLATKGNKK